MELGSVSIGSFSSAPVAAAEQREAAFGCESVVKSAIAVCQENLAGRVCDGCAAERSLALLGSCYRSG
ncbi:hypothetical protein AF70_00011210 [Pseudomonas sp. KD5]|uniref:Uncharacterized protein n=1 Tax=Pseudomonas umsongensis TaxID=198618 RepID=A0ACC5MBS5_9PSED|nr:hypothetical protein [Pseudomonas umsongensis]NMN75595.1 hypothetical protein [Pseudomonas sp. KD5]